MNEYKITYTSQEGNGRTSVIEVSEKAARKAFSANHRGWEITDVELVDVDAPATKEQERRALEKIKAMVAELGPRSYLKTAFEGVFEDAETNIENDFAFSMKSRVESAEAKLREMSGDYVAAKRDADALKEQLAAAQEQIAALTKRQLPEELRRDLWIMTTDEAEKARAQMAASAETMAHYAETPQDIAFTRSVATYRAAKERAELMEQRADALDAMEPERKEGGAA